MSATFRLEVGALEGQEFPFGSLYGPFHFPVSSFRVNGTSGDGVFGRFERDTIAYKALMDLVLVLGSKLREEGMLQRVLVRACPRPGAVVSEMLKASESSQIGGLDMVEAWQLYFVLHECDGALVNTAVEDALNGYVRHLHEFETALKTKVTSRDSRALLAQRAQLRQAYMSMSLPQSDTGRSVVFSYEPHSEDLTLGFTSVYEVEKVLSAVLSREQQLAQSRQAEGASVVGDGDGDDGDLFWEASTADRDQEVYDAGEQELAALAAATSENADSDAHRIAKLAKKFAFDKDRVARLGRCDGLVFEQDTLRVTALTFDVPHQLFDRSVFLHAFFPQLNRSAAQLAQAQGFGNGADELANNCAKFRISLFDRNTRRGKFTLLEQVCLKELAQIEREEDADLFKKRTLRGPFAQLWSQYENISRSGQGVSKSLSDWNEFGPRARFQLSVFADLDQIGELIVLLFSFAEMNFIHSNHALFAKIALVARCVCFRGAQRRPSLVVSGPPGTGKSEVVKRALSTIDQSVVSRQTYCSNLSDFVNAPNTEYWLCQTLRVIDEMPPTTFGLDISSGGGGPAAQQETDATARRKELMTNHYITTERNVQIETRDGKTQVKDVQVQRNEHITIGSMNHHACQMNEFISSRFAFMSAFRMERADGVPREVYISRDENAKNSARETDMDRFRTTARNLFRQSFIEQFIYSEAEACKIVCSINSSVWNVLQKIIEMKIVRRGAVRDIQRRFEDVLCVAKALTLTSATMQELHRGDDATNGCDQPLSGPTLEFARLEDIQPHLVMGAASIYAAFSVFEESFFPQTRAVLLKLLVELCCVEGGLGLDANNATNPYIVVPNIKSLKNELRNAETDIIKQLVRRFGSLEAHDSSIDHLLVGETHRLLRDTIRDRSGRKCPALKIERDESEFIMYAHAHFLTDVSQGFYNLKNCFQEARHPYCEPGRFLLVRPFVDALGVVHVDHPDAFEVPIHDRCCALGDAALDTWNAHDEVQRARMDFVAIDRQRGCSCFRSEPFLKVPDALGGNAVNENFFRCFFGDEDPSGLRNCIEETNATENGLNACVEITEPLTWSAYKQHMTQLGLEAEDASNVRRFYPAADKVRERENAIKNYPQCIARGRGVVRARE